MEVLLDGDNLTIPLLVKVVRSHVKVRLAPSARERIIASRKQVEELTNRKEPVYGLNTGFGALASVSISERDVQTLQKNLILSHAVSVGEALCEEEVRAIMLLRANTFCKGHSGVRLETVQLLVDMLNKDVYPYIPSKGSVGASGDLSPLSHLALVMIGRGEAFVEGVRVSGADALAKVGLQAVTLSSKEGLALNNGTTVMAALGSLAVADTLLLFKHAVLTTGLCFEAVKARSTPLDERVHKLRPQRGQIITARMLRELLAGSQLVDSKLEKVQDAYSIRAAPVVLGASLDAIQYVKQIIEIEINTATDNPLIFPTGALSAANFHGQPLALALDFLKIAVAELGNIAERRVARLVDSSLNEGLPAFLVKESGLNSGFMIPQYTAAALVSENKMLSHPASVDSIPTCANQEDHVSMGSISAQYVGKIIENVRHILAIETLISVQAIEMRGTQPSPLLQQTVQQFRSKVDSLSEDREMYADIQLVAELIQQGFFISSISELNL